MRKAVKQDTVFLVCIKYSKYNYFI